MAVDPYAKALASPSKSVWPGCGDGRCMPCGRVHDFGSSGRASIRCWRNHQMGCPQPHPEPEHEWRKGRCSRCMRRARWLATDGRVFRTVAEAHRAGVRRCELTREQQAKESERLLAGM